MKHQLRNLRQRLWRSRSRLTPLLALYFVLSLILPNCVLTITESYSLWSKEAGILLPLGFYLMWSVALRRSGVMIWLGFPFIFFAAFQLVLLYLFGDSIIAPDMFTNVVTTNPNEAGELLANIYPAVVGVGVVYLPMLWLAWREIAHRHLLSSKARATIGLTGAALFLLGLLLLWPASRVREERHILRDEIFPINVAYNVYLSATELRKTLHYEELTADFRFDAHRTAQSAGRELYVYVIGEASRAMSWSLYGYERETTPRLAEVEELVLYRNVLTQSNTTHKSVPMMLSSVHPAHHEAIYHRKGLLALFSEAGFESWFISNQLPQGAMIDNLASEADHLRYLDAPRHDEQLVEALKAVVAESTAEKLMVVLHCYGSHFSYFQRYPRDYAHYLPEGDVAIHPQHYEELRNTYDNSIRYTDSVLADLIDYLRSQAEITSALLYCSDHGEDLFDDERGRFLHASPTTTAYQLHVASLAWFSERYREAFPAKVEAAANNAQKPATTRAMYHTMADLASIEGRYCEPQSSLASEAYDAAAPRRYLSVRSEGIPYSKTGLEEIDLETLRCAGVEID
ncbi:MAG: lipid A phosphoethanolamine transferase [Alistipes sp.]|nr:lipid A phosphoethanolamine transferase [Alistipes sp.]